MMTSSEDAESTPVCSDDGNTTEETTQEVSQTESVEEQSEELRHTEILLEDRLKKLQHELTTLKNEIKLFHDVNRTEAKELEEIILEIEKNQLNGDMVESQDYPTEEIDSETLFSNVLGDDISESNDSKSQTLSLGRLDGTNSIAQAMVKHSKITKESPGNNILKLHLENKLKIRRECAAYSYQQHLLEVEKLCNEELMRVKQNVSQLEPLTKMASEWSSNNETCDRYRFFKQNVLVQGCHFNSSEFDIYKADFRVNKLRGIPLSGSNIQGLYNLNEAPVTAWSQERFNLENLKFYTTESVV